MNEVHRTGAIEDGPLEGPDRERIPVTKLAADPLPKPPDRGRRSFEPWLLGGGALLLLVGGLAFGASQLRAQNRQVMAISEQQQNFVPNVRVDAVRASDSTMVVSLPATTLAFAAANIFARANGYIEKRTEAGGAGLSPIIAVPDPATSATSCNGGSTMLVTPDLPTLFDNAGATSISSPFGC